MTRPRCRLTCCERPHHARGYCRPHYLRWRRHGDPQADVAVDTRVRGGVSYWAARRRVLAALGPVTDQRCAGCGSPAAVWSYDGADPDERREPGQARRYSLNPDRYRARCRPCTRRSASPHAAGLPEPDVERAVRLYRAGASPRGIGALLGVSRTAVLRALRAHHVALRPSGHRR